MNTDMMTALLVVGVILAIALLWGVSVWSARQVRSLVLVTSAASVIVACTGLVVFGLCFSAPLSARPRLPLEVFLQYVVVPLFLVFPGAVTFCLAQGFVRGRVARRTVNVLAAVGGIATMAVAPFALIAAGCGLAGVCF